MKRFLIPVLLLLTSFGLKAQTADEVIANYINAIGGADKIAAIKTLTMTGSLDAGGVSVVIDLYVADKKGYRMDIDVPGMERSFQIYTPEKGWSLMAFQGQTSVSEVTPEQVKTAQSYLDAQGVLYNYKEKGYKVELQGSESVEGIDCYKLKIESAAGKITTFLLDKKTYYKVKAIASTPSGQVSETLYSNFKKTPEGYVFAYSQTNASGTIEFSSIEVNKPIDDAMFRAN